MISFDEVGAILDEISLDLPIEFFKELNGGINLLPDIRLHSESSEIHNLYVLGEYHNERGLGRYINIYYGSFIQLYSNVTRCKQKAELRRILLHEFTHHLESLAGEDGLEKEDACNLAKYKKRINDMQKQIK